MSLTIDRVNTEENGDQYQELPSVQNKSKFNFKENFKKSLTWEKGALTKPEFSRKIRRSTPTRDIFQ